MYDLYGKVRHFNAVRFMVLENTFKHAIVKVVYTIHSMLLTSVYVLRIYRYN